MSKNPLIISFYTDDWIYPEHAKNLINNCENLGYEHFISHRHSTKNYLKNTAIKPFFIKECLLRFRRPLIWIDVDAIILKEFSLNVSKFTDIGACKYTNSNLNRDWAVAFLYLNYTSNTLDFITRWCEYSTRGSDEYAFDLAWKSSKGNVAFETLPEQYHFVKWKVNMEIPDDTIICHQLSQFEDKLKRKHNGQVKDYED